MDSKKPSKKIKNPILTSNPRFFATSRSAHRAYKYFSSMTLYQSSHRPRDQRFEGLFDRIKYIKRLNVPMIVGVSNSNQLIKRVKVLSKTMTHSSNVLSYLLSKGKQTLTLAEYHQRAFRASQSISEAFLQNFSCLEGLKYLPNLRTLKLWGNSRNLSKLEEKFYDLLPDLKKLRHLYAYEIKLDKLFDHPKALSNLYSLHASNLSLSRFGSCNVEKLKLKQLEVQNATVARDFISFLDDLPIINSLKQIKISARQSITSKPSKAKIAEFLARYGLTISPTASKTLDGFEQDKPDNLTRIIEDDKYSLKMYSNSFTFTIK